MLVTLLDGDGEPHVVTWQGQDQINDGSGVLGAGATGVAAAPQQVAAANTERAGFLFQNTSATAMLFYEIGTDKAPVIVNSGAFFPPFGNYPIPTGAINVQGTAQSAVNDTFTYREWVNGPDE